MALVNQFAIQLKSMSGKRTNYYQRSGHQRSGARYDQRARRGGSGKANLRTLLENVGFHDDWNHAAAKLHEIIKKKGDVETVLNFLQEQLKKLQENEQRIRNAINAANT